MNKHQPIQLLLTLLLTAVSLAAAPVNDNNRRRAKELIDYAIRDLIPAKDYDGALKYLDTALTYNPEMWQAYATKGYCYYLKGEYDISLANYQRAQQINPGNEKINRFIASVQKKQAQKLTGAQPTGPEDKQTTENYRTSDESPKPRRREGYKYIKSRTRRSWGVEASLVYLSEDSLNRAAKNTPQWAGNAGYTEYSANKGALAKCISIMGGMRAGNDFRLITTADYIFGASFEFSTNSSGVYGRINNTIKTNALMFTGGFEYLVHLRQFDLGFGLRLGMLDGNAEFCLIEEDPSLGIEVFNGNLSASSLCFVLDSRLEHYFSSNFSLFSGLAYKYARLNRLRGYSTFGESVALLTRKDSAGEVIVVDYEFLVNAYPDEYSYADISFGGLALSFGLEIHY